MATLRTAVGLSVIVVAAVIGGRAISARAAASGPAVPAPTLGKTSDTRAVLAGGCFWGVEEVFEHVKGVRSVVSGYANGAESVRIVYDTAQVSYGTLLRIFFSVVHDPTQLDRQGPDRGPQYRSAILYESEGQRKIAEAYIAELTAAHAYPAPIVTEVTKLQVFQRAEEYHQDYARKNPRSAYILINDVPKVAALRRLFPDLWRETQGD